MSLITRISVTQKVYWKMEGTDAMVQDVRYSPVTISVGCFIKGTTVLKGSYEGMDICSVSPETVYLGGEGKSGKTSKERVQYEVKSDKLIYGFNGGKPFFTADHPFATQDGWRALDPMAAKRISPWLEIGPLQVGDYLKRLSPVMGPRGFMYKPEKIENITVDTLEAGNSLYGLHTHEGPRSYHANGYLVHLNYPEISSNMLLQCLAENSSSESESIIKYVLDPLITDMHGEQGEVFLQNIKNGLQQPERYHPKTHLPLEEVTLINMPLIYEFGKGGDYMHPRSLSIYRGKIFLDDEFVPSKQINDNQICWTRYVYGVAQHGNVHLDPDRMTGYGRLSGDGYFSARGAPHVKFSTRLPLNEYNCQVGVSPLGNGGFEMKPWGSVLMGFEENLVTGHMQKIGKVVMPPIITEADDLNHGVVYTIDEKTQGLKVVVNVPIEYCAIEGGPEYMRMEGLFNWDFSSLHGTAIKYDANAQGFEGETFKWTGQLQHNDAAQRRILQFRTAFILLQKSNSSSTSDMNSTEIMDHRKSLDLANATRTEDLNLEELFTLVAPPQSTVHQLSFDLIKNMMTHQLKEEWREGILGITKPDIGNLEQFALKNSDFLADTFGAGYIGSALSTSPFYENKFTEDDKNKLLYFWSGDSNSSLSRSKDYSNINTVVSVRAYLDVCPNLKKYAKDNPKEWARRLFEKFEEPEVMNMFILNLDAAQSNALLQKQCMVLQCLAPDVNYGAKLHKNVMIQRLNNIGKKYKGSQDDWEIMKEFMYDAFGQLITRIVNGTDGLDKLTSKKLQQLIADSKDEVTFITNVDYMSFMQNLMTQGISLWAKEPGLIMDRLGKVFKKMTSKMPSNSAVGKVLSAVTSIAMWAFMGYSVISQFMNWSNLSAEQKVSAVTNAVSFAFGTLGKLPDMVETMTNLKEYAGTFKFAKRWSKMTNSKFSKIKEQEFMDDMIKNVEGVPTTDDVEILESEQAVKNGSTPVREQKMTKRMTKFYNVTTKAIKLFNIAALGAATVAMGFQIARDFEENQKTSVKVLDICQAAVLGLQVTVETLAMVFSNAVLSSMGSVLAIVGIIVAIVLMVVGRDPVRTKNQGDNFIDTDLKTFLAKIPKPPVKWLNDFHKNNEDKDDTKKYYNSF